MGSRPMFEGGVALVFPGQGSQFVGMGQHLLDTSPVARETVAEADEVLGFDLSGLMANGPAETLEDTVNAQPAILAVSVAARRAMRARLAEDGTAIGTRWASSVRWWRRTRWTTPPRCVWCGDGES